MSENQLSNEENALHELNLKLHEAQELNGQAKQLSSQAKAIETAVANELDTMFRDQVTELYLQKDEPFGTARIKFESLALDVVADTPKKVSWDQKFLENFVIEQLQASMEAHTAHNNNGVAIRTDKPVIENIINSIRQYVKVEFSIPETIYKTWPDNIRNYFEPARTVAPGKTSITIEDKAK